MATLIQVPGDAHATAQRRVAEPSTAAESGTEGLARLGAQLNAGPRVAQRVQLGELLNGEVVQRTVLHDVNVYAIKEAEETYMNKKEYADEFEIYDSANKLAGINETRSYSLKEPNPKRLKHDEPVILVGHGGHGQFMNVPSKQLVFLLKQWGVKKGTQVVFAGCDTATAGEAIEAVTALTGLPPVVNDELTFTAEDSEYRVPDDLESKGALKDRTKQLKKIEIEFVRQVREAVQKMVAGAVTPENAGAIHSVLRTDLGRYNFKTKVEGWDEKKGTRIRIQHELTSLVAGMLPNSLGKSWGLAAALPGILKDLTQISWKLGESGASLMSYLEKGVPEAIGASNRAAVKVTRRFIAQVTKHSKAEKVDYQLEANKPKIRELEAMLDGVEVDEYSIEWVSLIEDELLALQGLERSDEI